jgi:hypothetical protein
VIGSVFLVGEHFIHDLAVAPNQISVCSCRFEDEDQDPTNVDQPGLGAVGRSQDNWHGGDVSIRLRGMTCKWNRGHLVSEGC